MDFEVDEDDILGYGGFGTVYRGRLGSRAVAAKTDMEASSKHREAHLLKLCEHMNVIKGYGVLTFLDISYLVMELAEAGSLCDHLGEDVFSTDEKKLLTQQLCRGLEHIHGQQIVHRDIKTKNLLLKRITPPHIVFADFGMAKTFRESSQKPNDHDVVFDRVYTHKSDVYLLALVACQIFEDMNHVDRVYEAEKILTRGLDENIFTEMTWETAILDSLDENPDVRPTAGELRIAFS